MKRRELLATLVGAPLVAKAHSDSMVAMVKGPELGEMKTIEDVTFITVNLSPDDGNDRWLVHRNGSGFPELILKLKGIGWLELVTERPAHLHASLIRPTVIDGFSVMSRIKHTVPRWTIRYREVLRTALPLHSTSHARPMVQITRVLPAGSPPAGRQPAQKC